MHQVAETMRDPEDRSGLSHSATLGRDLSVTVAQGAPVQDSAWSACRETRHESSALETREASPSK